MVGTASLVADLTPSLRDAGEGWDVMGCPALIFLVGTGWKQPRVLCYLVMSHALSPVYPAEASYITWLTGPFGSRN